MAGNTSSTVVPIKEMTVIEEIKQVFHETTGLALSFHYPEENDYDFYPAGDRNSYCELIQSTPEGLKRCLQSDCEALKKAQAENEYCIYTCHAGLMNAVIPLIYKSHYIGSIFTGQVFTTRLDEPGCSDICRDLCELGLDEAVIRKEMHEVQIVEECAFHVGIRLLNFMANHIISVEDELYLQKELHQKEREILKHENIQMNLKNDLQKLSILILKDEVDYKSNIQDADSQSEQQQAIIKRAHEFIEENFSKPLALSDVAEAVYLSPNYFSTLFKEITGDTFSTFLNTVRIQEGKKLLRETSLPIKQIVEQVGFEDYNYFNRVFKKIIGIPPATYRDVFGTDSSRK